MFLDIFADAFREGSVSLISLTKSYDTENSVFIFIIDSNCVSIIPYRELFKLF
jgi:hypothetical protein